MNLIKETLEGIDYLESSPLAMELEIAIKKLRTFSKITKSTLKAVDLDKIIKKITGLNVKILIAIETDAYVEIPGINVGNPILSNWRKRYLDSTQGKAILDINNVIDGTVNLRKGTVAGDWSKIENKIYLGEGLLRSKSIFTTKETTAILLHEIGHIFVYMEMLGRVTRTNFIMSEAVNRIIGSNTKEQRVKILHAVEDIYGEKIEGFDKLAEVKKHPDAYRVIFMSLAIKESENQINDNIYDVRSFESLADTFATRHGLGRDLATGLDKLYRSQGNIAYRGTIKSITFNMMKVIIFLIPIYTPSIILFLILLGNPLKVDYDPVDKRIRKIRQQLNGALKERGLAKEHKIQILEDIDVIKTLEKDIFDNKGIIEFLWQNVLPHGRKQRSLIKIQEKLETMLNNRLFETAARLETGVR